LPVSRPRDRSNFGTCDDVVVMDPSAVIVAIASTKEEYVEINRFDDGCSNGDGVLWWRPGQTMQAGSALPRLVRFSGTAKDARGNPVTGVAGITFALYAEQTGGAALWSETQNVPAGPGGHYTVLLGAAKFEGLPADLFTAEQAHWVGVSVEGQAEQPPSTARQRSGFATAAASLCPHKPPARKFPAGYGYHSRFSLS